MPKCGWRGCDVEIGKRVGSRGKPRKYCCCQHKYQTKLELMTAQSEAYRMTHPRSCESCGAEFIPRAMNTRGRFCSDRCQWRAREKRRPPEQKRAIGRRYQAKCWKDPSKRLKSLLRNRLFNALAGRTKPGSAVRDLGCSVEDLVKHLEAQFQPGMTWDNWSQEGWHVDHIRPLATFDLADRAQFLEACHFTNLQPMWAKENLSKGARWTGTSFHGQTVV